VKKRIYEYEVYEVVEEKPGVDSRGNDGY